MEIEDIYSGRMIDVIESDKLECQWPREYSGKRLRDLKFPLKCFDSITGPSGGSGHGWHNFIMFLGTGSTTVTVQVGRYSSKPI